MEDRHQRSRVRPVQDSGNLTPVPRLQTMNLEEVVRQAMRRRPSRGALAPVRPISMSSGQDDYGKSTRQLKADFPLVQVPSYQRHSIPPFPRRSTLGAGQPGGREPIEVRPAFTDKLGDAVPWVLWTSFGICRRPRVRTVRSTGTCSPVTKVSSRPRPVGSVRRGPWWKWWSTLPADLSELFLEVRR